VHRKILVILRGSPYGGARGREGLDAAMLFSAFSDEMSVLFSGDGVWQLQRGQRPGESHGKPVEAMLGAFEAYDIHRVYADAAALDERGIAREGLLAGARALDADDLRALIAMHDRVVSL